MKTRRTRKLLRYWWLMTVVVIVGAPALIVISTLPRGDRWQHEFRWLPFRKWGFTDNSMQGMGGGDAGEPWGYTPDKVWVQYREFGVFSITSELPAVTGPAPSSPMDLLLPSMKDVAGQSTVDLVPPVR